MKKILVVSLLFLSVSAFAKVSVIVSIVPQKSIAETIGGENVTVSVMVPAGSSPHNYEPKPSQMKEMANANVYFSIGVEFEEVWLERFADQNKNMAIVDVSSGIEKIEMAAHSHDDHEAEHEAHDEHEDEHGGKDPHVWTSPENLKIIAKNIYETLVKNDTSHADAYEKNYKAFIAKVDAVDTEVQRRLSGVAKGAKFMVFHPAFGYFAKQYNLTQFPIEVEGKEPKPKTLQHILDEAKEEQVKAIVTQPEFSDKSAKIIADALGIKVIKISPLNPDWEQMFYSLADSITQK